ncbi:hypothetical protein [Aliarcobacter skirrowii]|uniref:Uncharacterized protein n=1 Tax=Aliarcobacter skirrowii TaxID=28200 RepID=A0AAW9DAD3_9BACT|nr:hypothetical protein [Aliarcobacter skirrowii]MDX4069150.1 hypothetical protein [Aliarcobacter skirrowii]
MNEKELEQALKLEEQKRENLLSKIDQVKENINFKLEQIEKSISSLDDKIKSDVKKDIWELKQNIKNIAQNEKNIAVLTEQLKSFNIQLASQKKEIEAKMVTTKDLDDKKYKDWRLWISIIAIVISCFTLFVKPNLNTQMEKSNVSANTQK